MGNQLVGIAPSQIFPVEWYLKDHQELRFESGLGSTRFLKVARADSQEGPIVVKVFAIHDPSLPLQSYKDHLEEIRKKLSTAVNCTPYQKFILGEKAALIMREYVKYSLYDRISTRPFLTVIEKKWITFQILYALHQCHKVGVCHGDIKLENITVTAWNWVMLVDFASFKPTFLPIDNPGDYSYFFDTSRRGTCYIAPERFSGSTNLSFNENSAFIAENTCDSGDLTPAMDIFSAGCALLELWNELHFPFDYSQLLAYRAGKYSPQKHLDKLDDPELCNLISSMIEKDPNKRLSAEDYLDQHRGKLFPEYFYTFLQSYVLIFSGTPVMSPDEKITRLKGDIANIFNFLGPIKKIIEETINEAANTEEKKDIDAPQHRGECEGLVLIISLVTSCIRGLHECSSKLYSLEILLELTQHASDETILDRILPFIMFLSHDNNSRVKIAAVNTITKCLSLVQKIPRSDANIFPEYILPELAHLANDSNACVRVAYAKNINTLAAIALRYLNQSQSLWHGEENAENADDENTFNYELELQALHQMVQQTVSALLADPNNAVKQSLINSGIHKLCVFFGKAKANDVILSHMITFLNDKDVELRMAFFENIVGVVSYIGWHCTGILTPLLVQGLTDSSEFVTEKAIIAITALTSYNLITKKVLSELMVECSYFLVHPSLWIRQIVAGFVAQTGHRLHRLDLVCKIIPQIRGYLKYPLARVIGPVSLLEALRPPIPRSVYDSIVSYPDINQLLETLNERKMVRDCLSGGQIPNYDFCRGMSNTSKNLFRRLEANGMTGEMEDYLIKMAPHLKKIHKHKANCEAAGRINNGQLDASNPLSVSFRNRVFHFSDPQKIEYARGLHRTNTLGSIDTNVNSDWNYSAEILTRQSESTNSGAPSSRSTNSRPSSPPPDQHVAQFISTTTDASSLHEKSYIQYRRSTCYIELNKLKNIQQDHYYEALRNKEWAEQAAWTSPVPPPGWHPRGVLVAHLHEHKQMITRLCTFPNTEFFASCSRDGTVRLWDSKRFEGKNIANRSKQQFRLPNSSPVTGLAVCDGNQSLVASCHNGWVGVLRVDPASTKMNLIQSRQLHPDDEGYALELHCMDPGTNNIVVYATLYGELVAWDLRQPGVAWRLYHGPRKGVITSFCIDDHQSWLALGTGDGYHTAWDLRFRLPITNINLPTSGPAVRIRKVIPHPTEHSWLISSVHGNNEISMWNLETGSRQKVLWGTSTVPPLSQTHDSQQPTHGFCAMIAGCIDRSPFLLSGGTDQRLRFWNLESPSESYLAIPAASDPIGTTLTYRSRLIDGTDVIYEEPSHVRPKEKSEEQPRAGPEAPAAGHKDAITDVALCKASQCYLITSSRDGVIKVWK